VRGHLAVSPGGIAVDKDWSIVGASRNGVSDLSRQPSGSQLIEDTQNRSVALGPGRGIILPKT